MDVVTRIREGELQALYVQADGRLHGSALKSLHERGEAQELVRQQYTGRYPFELLQNANDAAREAGRRGRVHFLLTETALIVADNGYGFGDEQVDAICSLGRSSKEPGEAVGHKGLGFKSVGEITDHPQIISARASFQFSRERVWAEVSNILGSLPDRQKLPVYAVPFPVCSEDLELDAKHVSELLEGEFSTVIRLPFDNAVDRAAVERNLLDNLERRLLLFLPHVDHLEVCGTSGDFSSEVMRVPDSRAEHVLLVNTRTDEDRRSETSEEEWLIYRGSVAPDAATLGPLGDAWQNVDEARFAVAVAMDERGQPRVDETFPLHVYFPTDERPGLRVAVHAEWVLNMDRRLIAGTPEAAGFNQMVTDAIGKFVASTVAHDLVERTGASASAVEALVPAIDTQAGAGALAVRTRWSEALRASSFLPAADGRLRPPTEYRLLPGTLPDLREAHQIANLDRGHTLRADIEEREAIWQFLVELQDIEEIGIPEFLSLLPHPTRDTVHSHYAFLAGWREWAGAPLVSELKRTGSVLGVNGHLFTPDSDTIFFPRERGDVTLPEDLPIPVAFDPDTDDAQALLRELGVKPFEWRELIRNFLIDLLATPETSDVTRVHAMTALRAYHKARLSGSDDLVPVLGRVLLPGRTADGAKHELRPASEVYFSAPWSGSDDLETIYGAFGQPEFLAVELPEDSEQRENDTDFYRMLGVVDHPRLDEAKTTERGAYEVGSGRHPHRGALFNEWLAQPESQEATQCPQGHPNSQQLRLSYRLDRHEELIESQDPIRLLALWRQLARFWGSVYEHGMRAMFWCQHAKHVGERARWTGSQFGYTLHSRPWVPVDRSSKAELVRPMDAWIGASQTPKRIQERIPRISESMYHTHGGAGLAAALHLTDAGRPRVEDLLELLGSIADEADARGSTNREIDQAARWAQRTLHDILHEDAEPHAVPGSVRLLASQCGTTTFVAQPPYAEDPLLRDTFEKQRPVLSAEAGLTKLIRYLSLSKLDDEVSTSALPLGEHHDSTYDNVAARINRIKPLLFALVRAENSSAENRVRRALRSLELIVCDQLVLKYECDGTEVIRNDAVCYIATRREKYEGRTVNVGTAYLVLDPTTDQPHWFPLGRQLAQYLDVPSLSDALTMLFTATPENRQRMMADRHITERDIADARSLLRLSAEEDEELGNILDDLIPEPGDDDQREPAEVAAVNQAAASSATVLVAEGDEDSTDVPATGPSDESAVNSTSQPIAPPPVDYSSVRVLDAQPGQLSSLPSPQHPAHRDRTGSPSSAPSIQTEEENRRVGKRGEDVVYNAERQRLQAMGKNPESVRWISKTDELSPFDLMSVDEDDQQIWIEVKASKGSDPTEPFYISHAELIEATYRRSRYYIYRVSDVDSTTPVVTRWADPLALVRNGKGRLLLAKAQMVLSLDGTD